MYIYIYLNNALYTSLPSHLAIMRWPDTAESTIESTVESAYESTAEENLAQEELIMDVSALRNARRNSLQLSSVRRKSSSVKPA